MNGDVLHVEELDPDFHLNQNKSKKYLFKPINMSKMTIEIAIHISLIIFFTLKIALSRSFTKEFFASKDNRLAFIVEESEIFYQKRREQQNTLNAINQSLVCDGDGFHFVHFDIFGIFLLFFLWKVNNNGNQNNEQEKTSSTHNGDEQMSQTNFYEHEKVFPV